MKYLLMAYGDRKKMEALSKAEFEALVVQCGIRWSWPTRRRLYATGPRIWRLATGIAGSLHHPCQAVGLRRREGGPSKRSTSSTTSWIASQYRSI
jgi:hypothetical protein